MKAVFGKSRNIHGEVRPPGDKSISHRAAILAALARGTTRIEGYSRAADCLSTISCLRALGVGVQEDDWSVAVVGSAGGRLRQPDGVLDAGNSATTMRLLAGVLAGQPLKVVISGDDSLLKRPMGRIIEPLTMMGARIRGTGDGERPPLEIQGGALTGIDYSPPTASAQVKSAILIAALRADGGTRVNERIQTRDHTERMMAHMGIKVTVSGTSVTVEPGVAEAVDMAVPGDFSSAAFLMAAALIVPGSRVLIRDVGLNPTRTCFLDLVRRMGARVEVIEEKGSWEPSGLIEVCSSDLVGITVNGEDSARAIDELPLLALLATQAEGITEIQGAGELRKKESDRIAGTVRGLTRLGADIEETDDGMRVVGPTRMKGCGVSAGKDHRIAMMLAVAGLASDGETSVEEWEWTEVSYPGFLEAILSLGGRCRGKAE